ncbi:MAG: hypothetical protein RJB13_1116 [Pseudomonadota bacterium]
MSDSLAFDLHQFSVWNGARWVLENVHLEIPRGAFCVVLGANGAGKSSLLAALAGVFDDPWCVLEGGEWRHFPTDNASLLRATWLGQKLIVSEDMSVREFLGLPDFWGARRDLRDDWSELFGVDELLDFRISALSGGQWQRVRLARALASESEILLLDEPDSALDARWRQVLWSILRERKAAGKTIVLALHHFRETLMDVSHWLGLEAGRLVFCESGAGGFPQAYVDRLFSEKSLTR